MASRVRLAILECDNPLPLTGAKYGTYGGVFAHLLQNGARAYSTEPPVLQITNYPVLPHPAEYPADADIDAILITGASYNAYDSVPWIDALVAYVRRLVTEQSRIKVIGVCFGHQIVGRALGARVGLEPRGWEVSCLEVQLTKEGAAVLGFSEEKGESGVMRIQQMHRDAVFECPAGVQLLGSSPKCDVQGMYVPRLLLTVQGHPEFDEDSMRELLDVKNERGLFSRAVKEDGLGRAADKHDGVRVAVAFLRFLVE